MRLKIELVPSTVWYSNIRKTVSRDVWDKIRKKAYKEADYHCDICGEKGKLHCHEIWEYNDEEHIQSLKGFQALCENCHMIKHAGFSMHTKRGREIYDREELIEHFCKVNNCSRDDFLNHEAEAFKKWRKRSKFQWKQDFGEYSEYINTD